MKYILLTDSSSDLPLEYVEANSDRLWVVGMPVVINGEGYVDDLGKTLKHDFFYSKLSEGEFPSTSQINTTVYLEQFEKAYEQGAGIICIGLSSGLSGTFNNVNLAKELFLEEHPEADISVIDTISASAGLGVLVAEAIRRAKGGYTKNQLVKWIEDTVLYVNHWFAIDDLEHLRKGGRIPAAIAIVGTALKVKPILTVTRDGKLKSHASVRGRNKSIRYLADQYLQYSGDVADKVVYICHADCLEDALELRELILQGKKPLEIVLTNLSATIGTHVGLGMLAVAFIGDQPRD